MRTWNGRTSRSGWTIAATSGAESRRRQPCIWGLERRRWTTVASDMAWGGWGGWEAPAKGSGEVRGGRGGGGAVGGDAESGTVTGQPPGAGGPSQPPGARNRAGGDRG